MLHYLFMQAKPVKFIDNVNKFCYNTYNRNERKCIVMAQTNINIRMDEDLKKQFDKFCSDIGMSMTTAICVFAKMAVKEQRIPFEIKADPFYSNENTERLEKAIADLKAGKGKKHDIIEVEDE